MQVNTGQGNETDEDRKTRCCKLRALDVSCSSGLSKDGYVTLANIVGSSGAASLVMSNCDLDESKLESFEYTLSKLPEREVSTYPRASFQRGVCPPHLISSKSSLAITANERVNTVFETRKFFGVRLWFMSMASCSCTPFLHRCYCSTDDWGSERYLCLQA